MMGDKKDGEDEKEDESLDVAPELTPEVEFEGKMMAGKKMDKKDMKEYKNPVTANHSDASDKSAKSPVAAKGGASSGASGSNLNQGQADSGNSSVATPQKMAGEFENTGGKAKSTSFKKTVTANTADGSEKSAKSTISGK